MFEDRNLNGPKKCHNCGSEKVTGPHVVHQGRIFFGIFKSVGREAYYCMDCFYTMYFIRGEDREKANKEAQKILDRY